MSNFNQSDITTSIQEKDVIVTYLYDYPAEYVFKAWTEEKHLAKWWGPADFTLTTKHFEFKPDGTWSFIMHGPDGTDYDNLITYIDIVENEKISYQHGDTAHPEWFRTTVTFSAQNNQTVVTMTTHYHSIEDLQRSVNEYKALEGAKSTLSRLDKQIPSVQVTRIGGKHLTLERVLNAPRELVFQVYSEPEHLKHWWGVKDWSLPICHVDFQPGGKWHYCMKSDDGKMESWGLSVYKEIIVPEKIVHIDSFSDSEGNINTNMPSMTITNLFIDLGHNKTKLVSTTEYASEEEIKLVLEMGVIAGATESWDRLVQHLEAIQK